MIMPSRTSAVQPIGHGGAAMIEGFTSGNIRLLAASTFPLQDVATIQAAIQDKQFTGKIAWDGFWGGA